MSERRQAAAATLVRLAGRDHHDPQAVDHAQNLATYRLRMYRAAEKRLAADRADLLQAMADLNPRSKA